MNNPITGVLIDTTTGKASIQTIPTTLESYYSLLNCSCIDIVQRKIGGKYFTIVCDDESLLKSDPVLSAVAPNYDPMLVGSLFICQDGGDGDLASLDESDLAHVLSHVAYVVTTNHPVPHAVLCDVEY